MKIMVSIPDEVFLHVLQYLSRFELEKCQLVCKNYWKFVEKYQENSLALRPINELWITNEGYGILYSEDCKNGWDMAEERIKRALNLTKTKYLGITIKNGTRAIEFLDDYFHDPAKRLLVDRCQIYYVADDTRFFPDLMTFFDSHILVDYMILSFGTYMLFLEIIETPDLLVPYAFVEDWQRLELSDTSGPSSSSKSLPILEKLEIGTFGGYGIDHLDMSRFLNIKNWPYSKKTQVIFHRLLPRHVDFFKKVVEKFRTTEDPNEFFEKMSFSMMNQPDLDGFFTDLGFKKGEEVNKFEEIREDGWKLKVYMSSMIEFYVKAPGVK